MVHKVLRRKPELVVSVSCTTRPIRSGERDGIDYHFIPAAEFLGMRDRGDFLESAEVYGHLYGTPRGPIDEALARGRSVLAELDIQGAASVKRARPQAVLIFIETPSLDDLWRRLRGRGTEDPETLSRRMRSAYEEIKAKRLYDHIIVNDDVDRAAGEMLRILEEEGA